MNTIKTALFSTLTLSLLSTSLLAKNDTTVSGEGQLYYYTTSDETLFDEKSTSSAGAVTFDIKHKVSDSMSANFTTIGYSHLGKKAGTIYMEGSRTGSFFNVVNLTGVQNDISFVLGRQLLDTPMLGSFDWLLAPSAFEAYTLGYKVNNNISVIGSYVNKFRDHNTGDSFKKLKDQNYAVGVAYRDDIEANLWFYRVDELDYSQFYLDATEAIDGFDVSLQAVSTSYGAGEDSLSYGVKASSKASGLNYSLALNHIAKRETGMVGVDSIYTSSWNTFSSQNIGNSWKAEITDDVTAGLSTTLSYAEYETLGHELDLILSYPFSSSVSLDAIYANTQYEEDSSAENSLEFVAKYSF